MSARLRSPLEALGKRISTRSGCWQNVVPCACGTVPITGWWPLGSTRTFQAGAAQTPSLILFRDQLQKPCFPWAPRLALPYVNLPPEPSLAAGRGAQSGPSQDPACHTPAGAQPTTEPRAPPSPPGATPKGHPAPKLHWDVSGPVSEPLPNPSFLTGASASAPPSCAHFPGAPSKTTPHDCLSPQICTSGKQTSCYAAPQSDALQNPLPTWLPRTRMCAPRTEPGGGEQPGQESRVGR